MLHGYKQLVRSVKQTFNLLFYVQFKLYPVPLPIYYLSANTGTSVKESWSWSYLEFIYKLGSRARCQARVQFMYSFKVEQTLFSCLWYFLFPLSGFLVTWKDSVSFQKAFNKEWEKSIALWDSKWLNNPCFKLPNTVCHCLAIKGMSPMTASYGLFWGTGTVFTLLLFLSHSMISPKNS